MVQLDNGRNIFGSMLKNMDLFPIFYFSEHTMVSIITFSIELLLQSKTDDVIGFCVLPEFLFVGGSDYINDIILNNNLSKYVDSFNSTTLKLINGTKIYFINDLKNVSTNMKANTKHIIFCSGDDKEPGDFMLTNIKISYVFFFSLNHARPKSLKLTQSTLDRFMNFIQINNFVPIIIND